MTPEGITSRDIAVKWTGAGCKEGILTQKPSAPASGIYAIRLKKKIVPKWALVNFLIPYVMQENEIETNEKIVSGE